MADLVKVLTTPTTNENKHFVINLVSIIQYSVSTHGERLL